MVYNFDRFPELYSPRLQLTALKAEHAEGMMALFTDERVTAHYPVLPIRGPEDMVRIISMFAAKYEARQMIRWAIISAESQELVGTIGFQHFFAGHKAGLVYALLPEYWGKGYAAEAIKAVTDFGFEQLQLQRIEAEVRPANAASVKVLQRAGFKHEGLLGRWMFFDGAHYDIDMYALLAGENS